MTTPDPHRQLLDHPIIAARYFFPRRAPLRDPLWVAFDDRGGQLACRYRPATREGALTVVHFHGNGEVVADYAGRLLEQALCAQGWGVCFAEYRGYGLSDGYPALGAMLDDTERVLDALELPAGRVVVMGRSVGSIYAVELAARRPDVAGLVLESGIHDVYQRLALRLAAEELDATDAELRAAVAAQVDQGARLARYPGATLLLHARQDHLVGFAHAEANLAASSAGELVAFDYGDHNSIFAVNVEAYLQALVAFVARVEASADGDDAASS